MLKDYFKAAREGFELGRLLVRLGIGFLRLRADGRRLAAIGADLRALREEGRLRAA